MVGGDQCALTLGGFGGVGFRGGISSWSHNRAWYRDSGSRAGRNPWMCSWAGGYGRKGDQNGMLWNSGHWKRKRRTEVWMGVEADDIESVRARNRTRIDKMSSGNDEDGFVYEDDEDEEAFFDMDFNDFDDEEEEEDEKDYFASLDENAILELLGITESDASSNEAPADTSDFTENELPLLLWSLDEGEDDGEDESPTSGTVPSPLERALLQGVVPADAGVGSKSLPGDFGFDPLNLATKDYIQQTQRFLLNLLPEKEDPVSPPVEERPRPPALILRDYREAEIRHGRLAMLASILWPLQEILDRFFLPEEFGSTTFVYGGITLPFLSLLMMFFMLLLGYLDIYAQSIKQEDAGDAFLPGECFWDPLSILAGAPDSMKWNMQERELRNGRLAMLAVLFYFLEEAVFHEPLITLSANRWLFQPFFTIPEIQHWLDLQFQTPSPAFTFPTVGNVDFVKVIQETLEQDIVDQESYLY